MTGFNPEVEVAAFCSAVDRAGVAVEGGDLRLRRQPQREGADAAEQVGDLLAALAVVGDQRGQRFLAGDGRLQERAGRQGDLCRAHGDDRRRSHQHQFAMARQPRQPVLFGDAR